MSENIIRVEHDAENPYFVANRFFANDRRLSWGARGMMSYFLSQRSDWKIWPKQLIKEAPDAGRDKVYAYLKELELAGYIARVQSRDKFGVVGPMVTKVTETPSHRNEFDRSVLKRKRDKPCTDSPYPVLPYPVNPEHNKEVPSVSNDSKQVITTMQHPTSDIRHPLSTVDSAAGAAGGGDAVADGTGTNTPVTGRTPKVKDTPAAAYLRGAVQLDAEAVIAELSDLDLETVKAAWDEVMQEPGKLSLLRGRLVSRLRALKRRAADPTAAPAEPSNAERQVARANRDLIARLARQGVDTSRIAA
jgi:hypothetical protein